MQHALSRRDEADLLVVWFVGTDIAPEDEAQWSGKGES